MGYSPWDGKRVGHNLATNSSNICMCVCVCVYIYIYDCDYTHTHIKALVDNGVLFYFFSKVSSPRRTLIHSKYLKYIVLL